MNLPPDPEGMNEDRAAWAAKAVDAFIAQTGQDLDDDGPEEILADLLADLMHLCDRMDIRFDERLDMARMHYEDETRDDS